MKDNQHTSPNIITAQAVAGTQQDRLSVELALLETQNVQTEDNASGSATTVAGAGSTAVSGGGSGGGSGVWPPCFTGETLVGRKRIDGLKKGDRVAAFTGRQKRRATVTEVFIHEVTCYLKVTLETGVVLNITPEHLVYDGEDFKAISKFSVGDWLFNMDFTATPIVGIEEIIEPTLVYNIETTLGTYFANGIAVHNLKLPTE